MKRTGLILIVALLVFNALAVIPANAAVQTSKVELRGISASEKSVSGGGFNLSNVAAVPVIWTTQSFAGFYFDLKDNLGKEELEIRQAGLSAGMRTINENNLVYRTSAQAKKLKVVKDGFGDNLAAAAAAGLERANPGQAFEGGNYHIVGWQGDRYVPLNGKIDRLSKLLFEHGIAANEKKTLTVGETWKIGDGWELTANAIDAKADPRQVWLTLSLNGVKKDEKTIQQGRIYTYVEKSIAEESDVPMFVTLVDSVFSGATSDMVQLRFTWVISPKVTMIKTSDKFGIFEVVEVNTASRRLVLENRDKIIDLSQNAVIDLIGEIKFRVADKADVLRFYPVVTRTKPGTYEVRGIAASEKSVSGGGLNLSNVAAVPVIWTPQSFAGFYFDLKDNLGKEELEIRQPGLSARARTINENNLVYRTSAQAKKLKAVKDGFGDNLAAATASGLERANQGQAFENGNYHIVGWQGEKYVPLNGKIDKLSKLLFEHGIAANEKKTLSVGEAWNMGDGWTLTANAIDAKADPRQVWFTLSRDGVMKDEKTIRQGRIYTYVEKSIAEESDVPMFVTLVDSVFSGATSDMVQLRFTWVISPKVTMIKTSDKFGIFEAVEVNTAARRLVLENRDKIIDLSQNTVIDLIGEIKFRVADKADVLRFYPKIDYNIPETNATPAATPTATQTQAEASNSTQASTTLSTSSATKPEQTAPPVAAPTLTKPPAKSAETVTPAGYKEPGFEGFLAIAGLLAVAYLVLRKGKN